MNIQEWLDKHGLALDSEFDEETVQRAVIAENEFLFPELSEEQQRFIDMFKNQAFRKEDVFTYASWLAAGDVMMWNTADTAQSALNKILDERPFVEEYEKVRFVDPIEYLTFQYENGLVGVGVRARECK